MRVRVKQKQQKKKKQVASNNNGSSSSSRANNNRKSLFGFYENGQECTILSVCICVYAICAMCVCIACHARSMLNSMLSKLDKQIREITATASNKDVSVTNSNAKNSKKRGFLGRAGRDSDWRRLSCVVCVRLVYLKYRVYFVRATRDSILCDSNEKKTSKQRPIYTKRAKIEKKRV